MKKILLIAPAPLRFELTQDDSYLKVPISKARSFLTPLHIATVAGLTPDGYDVRLWDESVHGRIEDGDAPSGFDIVGLTGYTAHLPRAREIAAIYRRKGVRVVIGGAGISSAPNRYKDEFDHIFVGEAEMTWPQFLSDLERGAPKRVYRQVGTLDLAVSPPPRWDSIAKDLDMYHVGAVQTSRGCPFDCEFCDVGNLFGNQFRHKPVENVLREIKALEERGVRKIVFCDDNFFGNPRYTKDLLRRMIELNASFRKPLGFAGEMSINIASDKEALELLADANFIEVFIGIESPNKESLKASNKLQNFHRDLVNDIRTIESYGLSIRGSLIVGFDHDGKEIFDTHYRFITDSCLTVPSIRVLMAPPGTRLWKRLLKEGRLVKTESEGRYFGNPGTTNIFPGRMTRVELHSGYLGLIAKVYDWDHFGARMKGFISNINRKPRVRQDMEWGRLLRFLRLLFTPAFDKKSRRVILGVMLHALLRAPYMLQRLVGITLRQYGYANRPRLIESIQKQIDYETTGQYKPQVERAEGLIPEPFLKEYSSLFQAVYSDLADGLGAGSAAEEAAVEVFTEFLVKWKDALVAVTDEHRKSLSVITAGVMARKGAQQPRPAAAAAPARQDIGARKNPVHASVLRAVEQELIGR